MGKNKPKVTVLVTTLTGALAGFFILHPYSAIVYGLFDEAPADPLMRLLSTFQPDMILRCIPFATAGGFAGLFFGLWLLAVGRKIELDQKTCAVDAMKGLVVTMSHYLLNASTAIGLQASRLEKNLDDDGLRKRAVMIRKEAAGIEAVMNALRRLESVDTESYTKDGELMMIDIKKKLEEELGRHAEITEE
jgi:signal transduction histidine kinase